MMEQATDIELLRSYSEKGSEEAFATLVRRYVDLVYSTARRQLQDETMAEEVTQATFIVLSRKARSLNDKTILSAWLYRTARFAAADARKLRARRVKHEQEAARMEPPEADSTWQEIEPRLDDAMNSLGEADRTALLLRFFENKTLREVGAALRVSDDTAQKRVTRALDRLRKALAHGAVAPSVTVLATILAERVVEAAPTGTTDVIANAAASSTVISATTSTLVKGTLKMIAWNQWKLAIGGVAIVLLVAGTATVVAQKKSPSAGVPDANAGDRSTPLGALLFISQSLERYDTTNLAASLHAITPMQERFNNAMVRVVRSEGALRKALEDKFGVDGRALLPRRAIIALNATPAKLEGANVDIKGTNAVVRVPGQVERLAGRPERPAEMLFVNIGGIWKWMVDDKGDLLRGAEATEQVSAVIDSCAEKVQRGDLPSAQEAVRSTRSQIGQLMRTN